MVADGLLFEGELFLREGSVVLDGGDWASVFWCEVGGGNGFGVGGDEGLASANLASLAVFAGGVVAHVAAGVVGSVFVVAVGAAAGVWARGVPSFPLLLVDVRFDAEFAFHVVLVFGVGASAESAPDGAVGVCHGSVFSAPGAEDGGDFLGPSVEDTGH